MKDLARFPYALAVLVLWMLPVRSLHANTSLSLSAASSQYVSVPANSSLTPTPLTFEAWVNIPEAGALTILSRGDGGNGNASDYIFQISNAGLGTSTQVSLFGAGGWDESTSTVPLNTWTHVAVTYDGTNKQFYINGVLNGSAPRPGPLQVTTNSPMYIGRQGTVCNCNFFQGQLAEVRIWNTVRTANQIGADMNASSGGQPGLVAYYHLNEGGGATANDATGNGNTGTLMNGASWANSVPPSLGTSTRFESPAAGTDSVVLVAPATAWTATTNASWLHLSTANQGGTGSTNVIFSFDANPGATRIGTLTIAGLTLSVTQAGSTYVAARPLTTLVSSGLNGPYGVAVDGAGNVYIADTGNNAIKEWVAGSNTVTNLVASGLGLISPTGVAVDGVGNVYITDTGNNAIDEWFAVGNTVTTLVSSGLSSPNGVAVDGAGNVYIADAGNNTIKEWLAASNTITTLVSSGLDNPSGVAVDGAGNVYIANTGNNTIEEWSASGNTITTLVSSGLNKPSGVAVDGAGNVYIADTGNNAIKEWLASGNTITTLVSSGLNNPSGVAVDGAGNVYIADTYNNAIKELPYTFLDPTPKHETGAAGSDTLPAVVPATQNLTGPFAPTSDQSWLTITSVTNGVVSFAFTTYDVMDRVASITLLGQTIPVIQPNLLITLGATNRVEGPLAGVDNIVLGSFFAPWTATANSSWLHLSTAFQSGTSSANVAFSFDANPGATRTGTITIAGLTLTVTQAGSTFVAATPLTTLVSSGLNGPYGVAVDGAGNVYIADEGNNAIKEWMAASNTVVTLVSSGLSGPRGVAVDGVGNVYIADTGNNAIKEWSAASNTVTTLVSSGLSEPQGVAVDGVGNVYIADTGSQAIKEWSAVNQTVTTLVVSSGFSLLNSVAVDGAGNVYFADTFNNTVKEWSAVNHTVTTLVSSGLSLPNSMAVDGAGNVYIADTYNSAIEEWSAASNTVTTLVSLGFSEPYGVAVDGTGNVYIANTSGSTIEELPRAFVDLTPKFEGLAAGTDVLPVVLPATENLSGPFAPTSDQSWLTITGVTNGVVSFSFSTNTGPDRIAYISCLGQYIQITQGGVGLGTTTRREGPAAGVDSVILVVIPATSVAPWTATANAPWLHLSAANQCGTGATNVVFSFDANTGALRTGTLTIAGFTLTVTQAGSTYVAATALATVVSSGVNSPNGIAVDSVGDVYIVDQYNRAITVWPGGSDPVITLVSSGLSGPQGVAVDGEDNVYIADDNGAIIKWAPGIFRDPVSMTTLVSGLNHPSGVAVDGMGNVYIAETGNNAIKEWSAVSQTVTTLVSSGLDTPLGVAVDVTGNVYIADSGNNAIKEWSAVNQTVTTLVSSGLDFPLGVAVDGAGNVYIADTGNNAIKEWSAASNTVTTLVSSGLSSPFGVAVDGTGNLYFADSFNDAIKEMVFAFVDPTPKLESVAAGTDALRTVLPATINLSAPFAPTSDQPWLTITGVSRGVVHFVFPLNTGPARTANITLLGQTIPVTQKGIGTATALTGAKVFANGSFQFAFTNAPNSSFTVLSTTNVSLPLSSWTPAGTPVENPPGQYLFTGAPATNSQLFYILRSP